MIPRFAWRSWRWITTAEEYIDANDDQVITRTHQRAIGAESRVPIEADFWLVHTIHGRKVVRLDIYASKRQGLEAAGLREAVSESDIDVLRRAYAAISRRDIDAVAEQLRDAADRVLG